MKLAIFFVVDTKGQSHIIPRQDIDRFESRTAYFTDESAILLKDGNRVYVTTEAFNRIEKRYNEGGVS